MHTFIIAEHPEFGKIRTVEKDGKIWFCARDIAASLGYANTRDAIDRHCKQKGVCIHDIPTTGGRQKVKFIDEGNVYRLIAGSRLPSAERFESWIFDELVPHTLKEGGYLLEKEGETDAELLSRALQLAEDKLKERDRYISYHFVEQQAQVKYCGVSQEKGSTGDQLQLHPSYRNFTFRLFHFHLHGRTVAGLAGYLHLGYLGLFHLNRLPQLFAPQLVALPVHESVVIHSIIRTELPKVLGLAAQLIEVVHLLVVYFFFCHNLCHL